MEAPIYRSGNWGPPRGSECVNGSRWVNVCVFTNPLKRNMNAHTHPALCPPSPSPRKHMSICARGFPNSLARCFPHEPCCPEREKKQKATRRQKTGLGESSQPHWPHPWGRGHQGPQASGSPPLSSISSRPGEARSPRAPCVLSIKCVGKIVSLQP